MERLDIKHQWLAHSLSVVVAWGSVLVVGQGAIAQPAPPALNPNSVDMAQLLYPPTDADPPGIMVIGQGRAALPADLAKIEIVLLGTYYDPYYDPSYNEAPEATSDSSDSPDLISPAPLLLPPGYQSTPPAALTRALIQPAIDAIVASGVPQSAIDVAIVPGGSSSYYYEDSAILSFELSDPSQSQVQALISDVTTAVAGQSDYYLNSTSVQYTIQNCQALEQAAYTSAIENARLRATALATALGVDIAEVPSVAESPFGLAYPACNEQAGSSFLDSFFGSTSYLTYYDPSAPAEVELRRDLFVTYPVR